MPAGPIQSFEPQLPDCIPGSIQYGPWDAKPHLDSDLAGFGSENGRLPTSCANTEYGSWDVSPPTSFTGPMKIDASEVSLAGSQDFDLNTTRYSEPASTNSFKSNDTWHNPSAFGMPFLKDSPAADTDFSDTSSCTEGWFRCSTPPPSPLSNPTGLYGNEQVPCGRFGQRSGPFFTCPSWVTRDLRMLHNNNSSGFRGYDAMQQLTTHSYLSTDPRALCWNVPACRALTYANQSPVVHGCAPMPTNIPEVSVTEDHGTGRAKSISKVALPCSNSTASTAHQDSKRSACLEREQDDIMIRRHPVTRARAEFLVAAKKAGMSYKDIRAKGNFAEAESTLRGRFRTLTKAKNQRVRRPIWNETDVNSRLPMT